jgi:hypothetical protein
MSFVTCNVKRNIIKHEPVPNEESKKIMLFSVGIAITHYSTKANIEKLRLGERKERWQFLCVLASVFRIRTRRIRVLLCLLDLDPSINKQKMNKSLDFVLFNGL